MITDLSRQLLADGFKHIPSATVGCFLRGKGNVGDDRSINGFNDFQQVDFMGGTAQAITSASAQSAVDDVVTCEGLQNFESAVGGNAQVLGDLPCLHDGGFRVLGQMRDGQSRQGGRFAEFHSEDPHVSVWPPVVVGWRTNCLFSVPIPTKGVARRN